MIEAIAPRLMTTFQASKYLAISERKLWSMTKENRIRAVRIGRCIRYDVIDLDHFINASKVVTIQENLK